MRPMQMGVAVLLAALAVAACGTPAVAQEAPPASGVQLLTPYLGVAVEPGDTASFDLQLVAPPGSDVDLEVTDVPDGWTAEIRGGGFLVDRVMIDDDLDPDLELEVTVPATAAEGDYQLGVVARAGGATDRLDFALSVAQAVGGGVALTAEFPALRGPSDVSFSFTLDLANDTGKEVQFGLQTEGPPGWQITAGPAGQSRASSVTVPAGGSERVTVSADPPDFAPAGVYPLLVQAAGGGETATAELAVEITGNFAISLLTPDDRLNVDVEAGSATELPLVVLNEGSAPLTDVSLSATPPRGWEVDFAPASLDRLEPGASAEVTPTITPSSDAIAGDYRITMRANVAEADDAIEVRATVETSTLWGVAGIGVIVVALLALGLVFRRFGRR